MKKRIRNTDEMYIGFEPKFKGEISKKNDAVFAKCLNWYSNLDDKKIYPWVSEYLSKDFTKKEISKILSVNDITVRHLAIFLRMKNNGTIFTDELEHLIDTQLAKIVLKTNVTVDTGIEKPKNNVVSIQDRILQKARLLCSEIDQEYDDFFFKNNFKTKFKAYDWLLKNQITSQTVDYIIDVYTNELSTLNDALNNNDPDSVESFAHLTKAQLKKTIAFIEGIINDCNIWKSNKNKTRKPRKKKSVSAEKQINNLKYMKEYTKLKLISIPPENIVGASQLWVYNTKYKYLTCYNSTSTFGVKGTTITNIDLETSVRKTCRKPDEILPKILTGGKRILKNIMNDLSTKSVDVNGRVNGDCILLKAIT